MNRRIMTLSRGLTKFQSHLQLQYRYLETSSNSNFPQFPIKPNSPVNPSQLLRVCTVLYQQQNSSELKLYSHLRKCDFNLSHEFFLQVCNKFRYSWKPVYAFFKFTENQPGFTHSSISFNKMVDVIGKSRNIDLLWEMLQEMANRRLVTTKTFTIALKSLASARELKKCIEFFHLMNTHEFNYNLETLNEVVEILCRSKLADEAKYIVFKLKPCIKPSEVTYKYLIVGFCDAGDVVEAGKLWSLMVDESFQPDIDAVEKMMETLFKTNRFDEALKLFQSMRTDRIEDLGLSTYRLVITWLCKSSKLTQAHLVFEEMRKRGICADNQTFAALVYGLLTKGRVREAYMMVEQIEKPDISVYHGLIKGLLKLRKASEATQVFREMIKRGCEPTMHTYIMLLQGHLGKRGRKGPDPVVNFDSIFVGGLVKVGKFLEATKYVERIVSSGVEVPRFDYNDFLHCFSNEEGVVMFEEVGKRLREVGLVDLADIFVSYGERMATRDRRRMRVAEP
ncbi:hypothetical protein NE237_021488 [Protea cynaroides]|uniref:Pentatricopeptide repeat-containing protein n=1 Tax=Protea cynaroides TaxID=273540 RepID=A0A9Q0K4X8_9MAGN|nr:hypothetical protein NE237_021488 [Protea cynaroides]